ncbi:Protein of unknown function [Cupriavidus sp. YR651]|nr:Protein of unknown function [Cupriavidus sp. YR651]
MFDKFCHPRLFACVIAMQLSMGASAVFAQANPAPAVDTSVESGTPAEPSSTSLVAELQQRMRDKSVRELRASVNGDYGATLMLADDQVLCYVGLSYQNKLWNVSRFHSLAAAESAYRTASKQSAAMADDEIRRQLLATQQRQYDRAIQDAEARASALSNDLSVIQAQRQRLTETRQASRMEVQAAEVDNRAARTQLEKLRQEIRRIESTLADSGQMPGSQKTRR